MDFTDERSGTIGDNRADELLPGLTIGYQATDRVFLFTNAQRSLVPVQVAQATREGDVANESAWNYEIGARFDPRPNLSTQATVFRIDYEDQIQFNASTARFENLGETRLEGAELQAKWRVRDNANLSFGYTYLDTRQLNGANKGNQLANAPHHRLNLAGDYGFGHWTVSGSASYTSASYSDAANTRTETVTGSAGKLPAYTLVNARIGRDVMLSPGVKANVGLAVNNLFDEDYYFRGVDVSPVGRLPGPGRSFIMEARLDF